MCFSWDLIEFLPVELAKALGYCHMALTVKLTLACKVDVPMAVPMTMPVICFEFSCHSTDYMTLSFTYAYSSAYGCASIYGNDCDYDYG